MNKIKYMIIGFIIISGVICFNGALVYAGDINGAEQQVISAASGTFQCNGSTYRAYPEYISELTSYFQRDDVNLSSSEVGSLIGDMNASVEEGYRSGYLYLVSGTGPVDKTTEESPEQNTGDNDKDKPKKPSTTKKFNIEQSIKENKIFYNTSDEKGDKVTASVDMVVKNTGYNISGFLHVGAVLLILLVISIAASCWFDLFAPADES